jgi:hypothetical protein
LLRTALQQLNHRLVGGSASAANACTSFRLWHLK